MPGLLTAAPVIALPSFVAALLIGSRAVRIARAAGRIGVRERIEKRNSGALILNAGTALLIAGGLYGYIDIDRRIAHERRAFGLLETDGLVILTELNQAGIFLPAVAITLPGDVIARPPLERLWFALQRSQIVEILRIVAVRVAVLAVVVVVICHQKRMRARDTASGARRLLDSPSSLDS